MKVLVCGSRDFPGELYPRLADALLVVDRKHSTPTLIHGAAEGADKLGERAALTLGWPVKAFPANWERWGRRAGPIRNTQMMAEKPDLVLAFVYGDRLGRGTGDMVRKAEAAGVSVEIHKFPKLRGG